jgi:O-antigen ligase
MLACDKRWLRIISILIVSIVIISSVKRGGLVALVIGLLTYIIIAQLINKNNFKSAILLCSTLVIMSIFFYVMISFLGDNILERLFNSDDETGSGRLNIWESLVQRLFTQDIELWVFGNGHLSTTLYSWENLSAHNDFLEIVYNYGIFNLFIYVCFLFSASTYTIRAIRNKDQLAPCLAMFLTIFLILSMISIIVLSHTLTLSMITLGFLIGWNEYDKRQRVLEQ